MRSIRNFRCLIVAAVAAAAIVCYQLWLQATLPGDGKYREHIRLVKEALDFAIENSDDLLNMRNSDYPSFLKSPDILVVEVSRSDQGFSLLLEDKLVNYRYLRLPQLWRREGEAKIVMIRPFLQQAHYLRCAQSEGGVEYSITMIYR